MIYTITAKIKNNFAFYLIKYAEVAEWQTHKTQNLARATSCGFDPHLRHHSKSKSST